MIILFEPQCRGYSHEQFNAGFLFGYILANPNENIVFCAEKGHIKCIQNIFISANLSLKGIQFVDTEIPESNALSKVKTILVYYRLFNKLLHYASKNNCNKIVFLSIYSYNLIPLKFLLLSKNYKIIEFNIAMHGTLEFIKKKNISLLYNSLKKVKNRLNKTFGITNKKTNYSPTNKFLYEKLFKTSLQLFGNKNINYLVFRNDSLAKLKTYIPKIQQNFKCIDLPYIFKQCTYSIESPLPNIKIFGTLGQGDLRAVYELVKRLNLNKIKVNDYEIRIIGGAKTQNLVDYSQIKIIGNNIKLTREKIEEEIKYVQYLLFFYSEDSYELTTSGSFLDAIAYCKPIIFLKNPCLDYYYQNYNFGYRCENTNEIVNTLENIIRDKEENYIKFISEIKRMQNDISISKNYYKLN